MDAIDRFQALEEIRRLKARYFLHLDLKNWAEWREVFADDVEMDVSGQFPDAADPSIYVFRGPDEILRNVRGALGETTTAHHGHSPLIDLLDDDEATGIWAMEDNLFMPNGSRVDGFGHYHETYRRIDGVWRIWRTRLTRLRLAFHPAPSASVA